MTVLETTGLTKEYGNITAVKNLELAIDNGEVFGFLGPNGAGKSTTINMLLGFLHPTNGRATILGHDVTDDSYAVRSRIGLLPEGVTPYENLSGRQHIVSAIRAKGANDDPDHLLDRVALDPDDAQRAAGDYSKGMQQRMLLAIALVGDPDLIILDEPASGLDPKGITRLRSIVQEEADRGATVFFSSHILEQVEKICDRVGIMNDGELVAVDTLEHLREQVGTDIILEAMVTEVPDSKTIAEITGVEEVTISGNTVRAACSTERSKMEVLSRLNDRTAIETFSTDNTSLESLFDEYTSNTDETVMNSSRTADNTGGSQ